MPDTLELLAQHWWPGNVRQLRNEIQRLVALSRPGQGIGPEHLSPEIASGTLPQKAGIDGPLRPGIRMPVTSLADAVDGLEREIIEATLHQSSGNISEAARTLGLTRRGLYLKLRRLGFEAAPRGYEVIIYKRNWIFCIHLFGIPISTPARCLQLRRCCTITYAKHTLHAKGG